MLKRIILPYFNCFLVEGHLGVKVMTFVKFVVMDTLNCEISVVWGMMQCLIIEIAFLE